MRRPRTISVEIRQRSEKHKRFGSKAYNFSSRKKSFKSKGFVFWTRFRPLKPRFCSALGSVKYYSIRATLEPWSNLRLIFDRSKSGSELEGKRKASGKGSVKYAKLCLKKFKHRCGSGISSRSSAVLFLMAYALCPLIGWFADLLICWQFQNPLHPTDSARFFATVLKRQAKIIWPRYLIDQLTSWLAD